MACVFARTHTHTHILFLECGCECGCLCVWRGGAPPRQDLWDKWLDSVVAVCQFFSCFRFLDSSILVCSVVRFFRGCAFFRGEVIILWPSVWLWTFNHLKIYILRFSNTFASPTSIQFSVLWLLSASMPSISWTLIFSNQVSHCPCPSSNRRLISV